MVIESSEWNIALLLKQLIAERYPEQKLAHKYAYAYHFGSGQIFPLEDGDHSLRITWENTPEGPQVIFKNAARFRLKCQGFCIVPALSFRRTRTGTKRPDVRVWSLFTGVSGLALTS